MNREQIEKTLSEVKKLDLHVPNGHKLKLRAALLEYGLRHNASVWLWLKENFKFMGTNFKPSSFVVGALVGVLLLGGVQFVNNSPFLAQYNPFATKKAQAQAAVKQAMFKAKLLSAEDRAKIEANLKADMQSSLEEAYKAKDLTIFDESEINSQGEGNFTFAVATPPKKGDVAIGRVTAQSTGNMQVKKYLKYTDPKGRQVVLGLNAEGVPVLKMMHIQISEGDKQRIEEEIKATGGVDFPPTGILDLKATGTLESVSSGDAGMTWQSGEQIEGEAGVRVDIEGEAGANVQLDKVINIIGE